GSLCGAQLLTRSPPAVRTELIDSCFNAGVVVDRKDSCSDCARGYTAPCCRPLFAAEAGFHSGFALIFRTIETCVALLLPSRFSGFDKVGRQNRERCMASLLVLVCSL